MDLTRRERLEKLMEKLREEHGVNIEWASRFIPKEG